jgi:glycosyltransferase involved in cell wall biosynthesis
VRVALDATPLLGARTGVGRYVERLVSALLDESDGPELALIPVTLRGAGNLASVAPTDPRLKVGRRRAPARLLREMWTRTSFPPAEILSGRVDVWHGTNFVLPPTRRARGVVTIHDLTYLRHPEWVTADVARYVDLVPSGLRRAAAVCTPSAAVRNELLEAYPWLDAERVHATPLTVDPALFATSAPDEATKRSLGLPPQYVLFLGSAEPRKGLDTLIAAYRLLHERGTDVPPLIRVGPPGWGPQASLMGLPDGLVRTVGYVSDVAQVIAGASLLAYPSRYEGFGLPPLEALACGVPVVTSDLAVLREVLGDQASYTPTDDPHALAESLLCVLQSGGPGTEATRRAHAASFTPHRLASATMKAYASARE